MANDKKFIVKNGLLTPQNAVIGSTNDTGEKLQVTGTSKFSGTVEISQNNFTLPTLSVTNSGGFLFSSPIAEFKGDSDSLQISNVGTGDYKLANSQQNNGIIFYDSTPGVRLIYNNSPRLDINSAGNRFYGLATTTIDGNRILTTADEGSGNGLDADTVDGLEANQFVRADVDDIMAGNYTIQQNLTVSGDLTVSGTTTTVNTEEILLADNIITLNSNYTGSTPTENSGIEIERGSLDNPKILWDEANDYWKLISGDLTDLGRIITTADEGSGNGFDADTVDGLEASQFLRSDVDDTAAGNITIEGDLTIGDDGGPAQVIFNGSGQDRAIYANNGEIGILNAAFNFAAKSDASGNWIVEKDVVAGEDVFATNNLIAGDSVTANTGSVSAATTVTAGTDVIAGGNVSATTGTVTAATDVIGQRFVDADDNAYLANPAGNSIFNNLGIDGDLFHNGDADTKVSFTTDDISFQTGGSERLGIDNTGVTATVNVTAPNYIVADDIQHEGDTDTKINFTTDTIKLNTSGATRLTANNSGIFVTNLTASSSITGDDITAITEMQAPVFYDSDNRSYYGDFAGTSVVNNVALEGNLEHNGDSDTYITFSAADTFAVYTGGAGRFTVDNDSADFTVNVYAPVYYDSDDNNYFGDFAGTSEMSRIDIDDYIRHRGDTDNYIGFPSPDSQTFVTGGAERLEIDNSGVTAKIAFDSTVSVTAPIFYDANDGNFYGDFASTSRVNDISLVGQIIHDGDTNTYLDFNAADSFQIVAGGTGVFTANSTVVTVDGDLIVTGTITGADANFTGDVSANNVTATTAMYAPVYYDADNNNYYGDFASTSVLNKVSIDDYVIHNGDTDTYFGFSATDTFNVTTGGTTRLTVDSTYVTSTLDGIFPNLFAFRYYDAENATFYTEPADNSRMNDITLAGEIIADGDTNTYLQFHNADQFRVVTGGAERLEVNNTYVLANNQMRSPIFYDSNNTNYYGNFASTSQMNRIDIDDYIRHRGDTNTYMGFDAADNWGVWTNGVNRLRITNSAVTGSVDFVAPRFVDSNNTSYYLDPANASLSATINGAIRIGEIANNSRWSDSSGNGGIALLSYGDDTATSNPSIAISGNNAGDYALMYLNRIDAAANPYDAGNRFITFGADGGNYSSIRGDSSGNIYLVPASSRHMGFWTDGGNEIAVALNDGNFVVGGSSVTYTSMDNTPLVGNITNNRLHVNGSIQLNGNDDAIVFGRGTSSFLKDEELGFGWGGGIYMTDATYLRIRGNKTVYSTGDAWFNRVYAQQNQAYYLDPDGDSQFNTVDIDDYIRHRGDTNTYFGFEANDTIRFWTNGTRRLNIDNNSADFSVDVYAPKFIDSDDNTWYIDGNATSLLRYLNVYSGDSVGEMNVGRSSTQRIRQYITDGVGYIQYWQDESDATDHSLRFEILSSSSGTNTFQFNRPIQMTGSGTAAYIYAQRFVDSGDNNFYADPAAESRFKTLRLWNNTSPVDDMVALKIDNGNGTGDIDTPESWIEFNFTDSNANFTPQVRIGARTGHDNGTSSDSLNKEGSGNFIVQTSIGTNEDGSGTLRDTFRVNYLGDTYSLTSSRAPIFYDSNNTAYYVNPNSTSNIYKLHVDGATANFGDGNDPSISTPNIYATSKVVTPRLVFLNDANGDDNYIQHSDANNAYTVNGQQMGAWFEFIGDKLGASTNNSAGIVASGIRSSYGQFNVDIRSPIFYDLNNTGYYVNPASTSRFNLVQALRYYLHHGTTYYMDVASGDYATMEVGGTRNSWAGYSIQGQWNFMSSGVSEAGIYNDTDNEWAIYIARNAGTDLYYNGSVQLETENGYALARNQMRSPIFYDSNNTAYYGNFAGGNTSTALRIGGIYDRLGFSTSGDGNNNILLRAQDYTHWIWQTATDWGIMWAGNDNPYRSYFSTSNPNELVFIGNGNLRASIDLDTGDAFFGGEVYADNYNIVGPGGNISLNPAYGSGGADLVLFDFTPYAEAELDGPIQSNESLTIAQSEYVEVADAPFAGKAIQTAAFRQFYSDYIPVVPGEDIYGEISVRRVSGSGGLLYYGVERFDKDRRPIAGNTGTTYFVVSAVNYTSTGWTTYRNHTTIPTSHTPYNGSDGGGVHYVRIRILLNYSAGGALRQFGGIMLKRRNVESNLLVDDILADDITADDITADVIDANIFRDRGNTGYYLDPANGTTSANLLGDVYVRSGKIQVQAGSDSFVQYVEDDSTASGRAQLLLQSSYSDLVIMSRNSNANRHGSTLTLATHSTSSSDYRKWVIGQGQYQEGADQLAFAYGANQRNPHSILGTDNANYRFLIDGSGHTYSSGSSRAPIFYDLNDTNYYVNPNVNSILHNVEVRNYGIRMARQYTHNGIWFNGGTDTNHVLWNHYYGGPLSRGGAGSGGFDGMLWNTYAGLRIRGGSAGAYDIARFSTTGGGNTNTHYVQLYANNVEQLGTRAGYGLAPNQMRSPVYYDYTNTAWYANPDGTSMLNVVTTNQLNMRDRGDFITFYGNDNPYHSISSRDSAGNISDDLRFNSYHDIYFNLDSNRNNSTGTTGFYVGHHGLDTGSISPGEAWQFQVMADGNTYSRNSFRTPIFYDRDDTNYYGDFASNSRFYDLQLRGNYVRTYAHSGSDFTSGTLVRTSIPATATNGASFVLEASGKSYSGDPPFSFTAQGYLYANTIINHSGQHFGKPGFTTLYMFENGGVLCFWWPRVSYWNSFAVHVRNANGDDRNLVTSITNSSLPGYSKGVATTMKVTAVYNQNINTGPMYATIYYDSNNTGYYADPHATSRMNEITANRMNLVGGGPLYFYTSSGNLRGYIRAEENNDSHLNIATSGNEDIIFRDGGFSGTWNQIIRGNGQVLISSRLDVPIMYDRNDTNYYVDPRSNSRFNTGEFVGTLTSNGQYYTNAPSDYWTTSITGLTNAPISTRNRDYNVGGSNRYLPLTHQTALYSSGYRTHLNTGLYKRASGWGDGSTGWYAAIGGNDSYPTEAWYLTYGGYIQNSRGYVRTSGSFRAPIFYDENNTGRYLDPNNTSRLQRVEFYGRTIFYGREADSVGSSGYITSTQVDDYLNNVAAEFHSGNDQPVTLYFRSGVNAPSDFGYITFDPDYNNSGENAAMVIGVENDGTGSSDFIRFQGRVEVDSDLFSSDNTTIMDWRYRNTIYGRINTDYLDHISDMRAPIFYDRNNTGYYVDPNSTSQLHYVLANNWFRAQGGTGFYFQDYGKGMWAPESGGNSYGNVTTYGSGRNGWQGWGIGSRHVFMSTGGDNVGIHDNSRGWIMYWNGSYTRFQFGYTRMDGSARSPIFYDLNNTAYYFNGASDNSTRFRGVQPETMAFMALPGHTRNSGEYYRARPRITGDSNYWTGAMGWGRVDMNAVATWGSGFIDSWSNPPNQPSGTSHWVGVQAFHYRSSNTSGYGWQMVGGPITNLRFRSSWSGWRSWRTIPILDENSGNGGAMYAGIYYDSNNTNYYMNPNGTSRWVTSQQNGYHTFENYGLGITGTYTSTRLQLVFAMGSSYRLPADGNSTANMYGIAWSHPNAGGKGGANQLNDHGMLIINNGSFRAAISSRAVFSSDIRSPIFYDWNSTGYYLDPNSTSNSALRIRGGTLHGPNPSWGRYLAVGTNGHWTSSYASVATTNGNLHLDSQGGRDLYLQWYVGRTVYVSGAIQATIYYDRNSTGYYVDPASTSRMNEILLDSSAVRLRRPNGTYGSFCVDGGGLNGYEGFSIGDRVVMMHNNSGVAGMYNDVNNEWMMRFDLNSYCILYHNGSEKLRTRSDGIQAQAFFYSSDERLKENIVTIENAVEKVKKLRGVEYNWKEDGQRDIGLIAQEVQEVIPEVVRVQDTSDAAEGTLENEKPKDKIDDVLSVEYGHMVGLLVEAVKEQQEQIEEQKSQIEQLKEMVDKLLKG